MSHVRRRKLTREQLRDLPDESLLTVREVARLLRIGEDQVRVWVDHGELQSFAYGTGRDRRIPRFAVREFLRRKLGPYAHAAGSLVPAAGVPTP